MVAHRWLQLLLTCAMSSKKIVMENSSWCGLTSDVVAKILGLLDILDIMNFSYTCKSWSNECLQLGTKWLISGSPTLVTYKPVINGVWYETRLDDGKFGLHDISKRNSFCLQQKCMENRLWIGGKDDWFVVTDSYNAMHLLNPITCDIMSMPSLNTIDDANVYPNLQTGRTKEGKLFVRRVVLAQTPTSPKGFLAIALFAGGLVAYTSRVHTVWIRLRNPGECSGRLTGGARVFMNAIVHNTNVVAVDTDGDMYTWILDGKTNNPTKLISPKLTVRENSEERVFYLAPSPSGDIMLICLN